MGGDKTEMMAAELYVVLRCQWHRGRGGDDGGDDVAGQRQKGSQGRAINKKRGSTGGQKG